MTSLKKRYLCTFIEIKANLKKKLNTGERFHDVAVEVANSSSYIQRGFLQRTSYDARGGGDFM